MAKIPLEVTETLWNLKQQTLEIVEEATTTEYSLFNDSSEQEVKTQKI